MNDNSADAGTANGPADIGQQPGIPQTPAAPSPDWVRANADAAQAQAALDAARDQVLQSLFARPDYRAALELKSAAEDRVDALHARGESNFYNLLPAAHAALEAREQVSRIENAAMAADPQIAELRTRLQAAVTNRAALAAQAR